VLSRSIAIDLKPQPSSNRSTGTTTSSPLMAACYRRAAASSASCWIRSTWRIAVQLINQQLRSPGADQALTGPAIGQELGVGTDLREVWRALPTTARDKKELLRVVTPPCRGAGAG